MELIAFPLHVGAQGWLDRSANPEESVVRLFGVMAATPQNGWSGSDLFGLRDTLSELQTKHGARLMAIKQMNQVLLDLEIDWVKVENIEPEPPDQSGRAYYQLTLSYKDKGVEVIRV